MKPAVEPERPLPDERQRLRVWGKWLLQIAVSVALLVVVVSRVDADRFFALVRRANWGFWLAGLFLTLAGPVVTAQRLRTMIRGLRFRVSLGSAVAVNLEAVLFSLIVPGDLVAGLVRWERISRHTKDRVEAFTVVAAERLIDWVVLALLVLIGAPMLFAGDWSPYLRASIAATAAGIALLGLTALMGGRSRWLQGLVTSWRQRSGSRVRSWLDRLLRLMTAGRGLAGDRRRVITVVLWTVAYVVIAASGSVMMARAVFPAMPVLPYVAAICALALVAQLPVTVGGVGLRELSLPILLGGYGVTTELGLLVGLSVFVPHLVLAAGGLIVRLVGRARLEPDEPERAS